MEKKFEHKGIPFDTSAEFWEKNYQNGSTSGTGSYGRVAAFKGETINRLVEEFKIECLLDFGCGDGNQNSYFNVPRYVGLDVSKTIVSRNRQKYSDRKHRLFFHIRPDFLGTDLVGFQPDMAVSLDVVFHLIEDENYHIYMRNLFGAGNRMVVIYTHDMPDGEARRVAKAPHVVFRNVEMWARQHAPDFCLLDKFANPYLGATDGQPTSPCTFFVFGK